jgi:hypothetical protein
MKEVFSHHEVDLYDISQSLELEFDPSDSNTFYFSCTVGLYKFNRK